MKHTNTTNNVNNAVERTDNAILTRAVMQNTYELCGKRIASIPIQLLELDETYQRVLTRTVHQLIEEWDLARCNFLLVSYRDGKFYIIDGQHRYFAAKAKGILELPCIILTDLTQSEEALVFARQNRNVAQLTPFDTYKANLACGDASFEEVFIDMEIARICDKYHVKVQKVTVNQKDAKILRSLNSARAIVRVQGSECFDWILGMITSTNWNMCPNAYKKEMLRMLKNYYVEHIDNLSVAEESLVRVLNNTTPMELTAMANYEYSEYAMDTALNLCLKTLTATEKRNIKIA